MPTIPSRLPPRVRAIAEDKAQALPHLEAVLRARMEVVPQVRPVAALPVRLPAEVVVLLEAQEVQAVRVLVQAVLLALQGAVLGLPPEALLLAVVLDPQQEVALQGLAAVRLQAQLLEVQVVLHQEVRPNKTNKKVSKG